MTTSSNGRKLNNHLKWRGVFVCLLTVLGLAAFTGYMAVHWVERQVLTTSSWVQVVGPLPKDERVATALSSYTVDKLVTATDLQNKIEEALPERASFLAAPLTDQLETRLHNRTKQVIQSDRFESIWTEVNRRASQRLLASARGELPADATQQARLNLDLPALKQTVSDILDKRGITRPTNDTKSVGLSVNLKTSLDKLKMYIQRIDFLNAILWLVAVACLLGALVLTYARRKLLLVMSSSVIVIALLQLIGVKALRPYILDLIEQSSYRPAVGVVYDTLIASFRDTAITAFVLGIVVFLLAFFLHGPILRRSKAIAGWMKAAPKSVVGQFYLRVRRLTRIYRWQIMGVIAVLGLAVLAFAVELTWTTSLRTVLLTIILLELVNLVSARPKEAPMKH